MWCRGLYAQDATKKAPRRLLEREVQRGEFDIIEDI
jgi:hypothetical protein